jgi:hypothetical protein
MLTESQAAIARSACHDVLLAYLTAVDHHRATTALECFTEDAHIVARGKPLDGHREIGQFLAEREADSGRHTAHLITNEVFEHVDADRVVLRARVVLLLHQETGGYLVDQIVETSQTFHATPSGWRIARRDETPLHDH